MALRIRRRRSQTLREFRLHKAEWVDPFPQVPGTEPEKRLFAQLIYNGIFFIFQGQVPELTSGIYVSMEIPGYKPDFILPQFRVIIDPFSEFHHSLPGAIERDVQKVALYTALGYTYYHPWAGEVNRNALAVLQDMPEIWGKPKRELTEKQKALARNPGYELGAFVGAGANSVAAANRARRKNPILSLSVGTGRQKRARRIL